MSWLDWMIVVIPMTAVMFMGFRCRKYIRGVVDFLSAGRLCGRYVLTIGDIANGISIIGITSYIEMTYKTGFAVGFWRNLMIPLSMFMALSGYCIYRFRETKAQSLGQFLEMRYGSRRLRFFASALRTTAEILAHSIMPAVAARFFIYFMALPKTWSLFGVEVSMFLTVMIVCMTLALSLICFGGAIAIIITDTIQGLLCLPVMVILVLVIFNKFDWLTQMLPVISDRVAGESFVNPFDLQELRDFNLFAMVVSMIIMVLHRATWYGTGASGAAKSPHEQKMAGLLGQWRGFLGLLLYVLISIGIMTTLNHPDFAFDAREIRSDIACRVTDDIITDTELKAELLESFQQIPAQIHRIGHDEPRSQENNLETVYLETAKTVLGETPEGIGKVQEFRTLYNQMMMSVSMRHLLGSGLMGLFALLMILAMVSTDDSYIFSSAQTIAQDLILPFFKTPPSPRLHMWILRICALGVGAIFIICSMSFAQMDYIELFRMSVLPMYLGGCGPMMVFGLYGRFGTRQGAWSSLLSGMVLALSYLLVQRNWGAFVYPFLEQHGMVEGVGKTLAALSRPFNPYVVWVMDPFKCPINSYESTFLIMMFTLVIYVAVSFLTLKEPFNLDRMLHRGEYNIDHTFKTATNWNLHHLLRLFAGITPMHTAGDKFISWALVIYSYVYLFLGCFVTVAVWNAISPWPKSWWSNYFLIVFLIVPSIMAAITAVWFAIGGVVDMRRLFYDLKHRDADVLDNGMVKDGVSIADYDEFDKIKNKNSLN